MAYRRRNWGRRKRRNPKRQRRVPPSVKTARKIGHNVGSNNAIVSETAYRAPSLSPTGSLTTRTLYTASLSEMTESSTTAKLKRWGNQINCRGLKYRIQIINHSVWPLTVNVAVVARKDIGEDFVNGSISVDDFFRGIGKSSANMEDRGMNFGDLVNTNLDLFQGQLNPDIMHIFSHKRYLVQPQIDLSSTPVQDIVPNNWKGPIRQFNKFIPIHRQLRYDESSNLPETFRPQLLLWADRYGAGLGDGNRTETWDWGGNCQIVWRRPK